MRLGYTHQDRERFSLAADAFMASRDGWVEQERSVLAMEASAGLAGALWRQGKSDQALAQVERVLDFLEGQSLKGVDEPIQIYLTCDVSIGLPFGLQ